MTAGGVPPTPGVLILEDDTALRETLVEALVDEGLDVRGASNGAEALDVIARGTWQPDLLILDLMTPVMDAFEFRRHQLARGLAREARVLVVSAMHDLDGAATRIDADAWLAKPFGLSEVIQLVHRLIREPTT